MYQGFINAAHKPGVTGRVVEIGPSGDPNPAFELLVRERYDLVVKGPSTVAQGVSLVQPVATRHPKTLFLVPDALGQASSASGKERRARGGTRKFWRCVVRRMLLIPSSASCGSRPVLLPSG
jgi:hypothetical protein